MGTNFYVVENVCECCKRYDQVHHIGKRSGGWAFSFHGSKYDGLTTWQEWKKYLADKIIYDEYGNKIEYTDFVNEIEGALSPSFVDDMGRKNLVHNVEGRKKGRFRPEYDWDDPEGYSFSSLEFS